MPQCCLGPGLGIIPVADPEILLSWRQGISRATRPLFDVRGEVGASLPPNSHPRVSPFPPFSSLFPLIFLPVLQMLGLFLCISLSFFFLGRASYLYIYICLFICFCCPFIPKLLPRLPRGGYQFLAPNLHHSRWGGHALRRELIY